MKALLENKHVIVNALLFQVLWFVAILSEWYLALVPLAMMLVHVLSIQKTLEISVLPIFVLAFIGIIFDSIYNYVGVYEFAANSQLIPFFGLPIWLASLWLGFCLTLPLSLAWLVKKTYIFVLACGLLGPVSYLAGRRMEALNFADANIWLLALEWCVFAIIALLFLLPAMKKSDVAPTFLKKEPV